MAANRDEAIIFRLENTFPDELERIRKKGYTITPVIEGYVIYREEHWTHISEHSPSARRTHAVDASGEMFAPTSFEARCLLATAQRFEDADNAITTDDGSAARQSLTFEELRDAWNMTHVKRYWEVANRVGD